MSIEQQPITTSTATLFTSSGANAITAIYLMNDHSNTVTVQLHVVTDGDTIGNSNKIIKNLQIAAGDTFVIDTEKLLLDNNDKIQATADVDSVCYSTISYIGV